MFNFSFLIIFVALSNVKLNLQANVKNKQLLVGSKELNDTFNYSESSTLALVGEGLPRRS